MGSVYLSDFLCPTASFEISQLESFEWLKAAYENYQSGQKHSKADYEKLLKRVGVSDQQIAKRGYFLPDFHDPEFQGVIFNLEKMGGISARQKEFSKICEQVVSDLYQSRSLPEQMIHVSCTGYVSPSPAQVFMAEKSPESLVTHSYHMGCYGAFPAVRMASSFLCNPLLARNQVVDVLHTELCTLHLNPKDPSLEQMLIQTLFSDGVALYRLGTEAPRLGFELKHLTEFLVPGSRDAMQWGLAEVGFQMTLSKDVPSLIAANLRGAFESWESQCGEFLRARLKHAIVAVHPGGPKIIDLVRDTLEVSESQVRFSRKVLKEKGNMSSATVPHIWSEILNDPDVVSGTDVISMAFGPGLTLSLSWMQVLK